MMALMRLLISTLVPVTLGSLPLDRSHLLASGRRGPLLGLSSSASTLVFTEKGWYEAVDIAAVICN